MSRKSNWLKAKRARERTAGETAIIPQRVQIPQASTIQEANEIAVQYGLAQHANFRGIDVSAANDILQSVAVHKRDFPELPQLEFIGTVSDFNKYTVSKYGLRVRNIRNAAAATFPGDKRVGCGPALFFNRRDLSPKNIKQTREQYLNNQKTRWWSVGTVKGVYDHEEGHQMEFFTNGRNDSVLNSLYNQYASNHSLYTRAKDDTMIFTSQMARALSQGGNKNIQEFIAEGWAEYRSSSNPRPLARAIGDRVMELYREGIKK